ncbi:HBR480Cp [Eremothecium sinecaudum]|uniref:HBR480Cp n=1 Tax=Eremothecium sinecaudum TaxID=45286 RepID=A0A120K1I4_9SACH|nr:HBR480Cp [Eremothecium sinecaudum]AMD19381.1 HBR480Cp [Eremothecium sinecaudum]
MVDKKVWELFNRDDTEGDGNSQNMTKGLGEDNLSSTDSVEDENDDEIDPNMCIECKDMATAILCEDCKEHFCVVCFEMLHRGGRRKKHRYLKLADDEADKKDSVENGGNSGDEDQMDEDPSLVASPSSVDEQMLHVIEEHANYIPMRLTFEERHLLRLLEAALKVSEYTDRVDILSHKSRGRRVVEQLKEMCSLLCGLVIATDLKVGQKLLENKELHENADWFQAVFEIGRRYKIMNPERMRDTFGKLAYMIMDSRLPQIEEHMGFHLYKPIKTVRSYLNDPADGGKALGLLKNKLLLYATAHIDPIGKTRAEINRLVRMKEDAISKLATKYSSSVYSKDDICQVLYSIGDYNAFVKMNRTPIVRMLERLNLFSQPEIAAKYSIGIQYGRNGARLTHDHERHWHYAQQSLNLWSIIQREMIQLWYLADKDLFDGSSYRLSSTGQGLHRIKACPALYKRMHNIINECKAKSGTWVGSSVVHLGDDAVPNALFFLDKYTQVPNILIPFDQTLLKIDELVKNDPMILEYINKQYGSVEDLKLTILQDAFAHMFDGSGADNFYMSGSCIDGRLTSAWNHTNQISKKRYYSIFLLTGFIGFNGSEGF